MFHNQSAFEVDDPEHQRAIADAIPIVGRLGAERAKGIPKGADDRVRQRELISDLEADLGTIGARVGWSSNEIEQIARSVGQVRMPQPAPMQAPADQPEPRRRAKPIKSFASAAVELHRLEMEILECEEVERINTAKLERLRREAKRCRDRLFKRGARGLR